MKLTSVIAAALMLLAWTSPSSRAADSTKKVIITFKSGTAPAARQTALAALHASGAAAIVSNGDSSDEFVAEVAEVPTAESAGAIAAEAKAKGLGEVLSVEDDYFRDGKNKKWIESDMPSFQATPFGFSAAGIGAFTKSASAGLVQTAFAPRGHYPWGILRVHAPAAWDYTQGAGVRVAVIDTGIDLTHPDLAGAVDGGYGAAADCERPECYQDDNGHGTHVAGTIAGRGTGQYGVFGVAPKARLYSVKVLGSDGSGSLSDVIKGIIWCANNDIQVANMSLGSDQPSDTMERALRYAKARGVVVVAAAGNSGGAVGYPGAYPETIAVAAADWNDQAASFSSHGPQVKFIAPGVAVLSDKMGGDQWTLSGTSMATPHVTGLAALAVSQGYRGLDGPDGVLEQLKKAARPLPGLSSEQQGYGMIDAGKLTRGERPATVASN